MCLPLCYFPTTTVLIDDNKDFLLGLIPILAENRKYKFFDKPLEALDYFKNYTPNAFINRYSEEILGEGCQSRAINFNLSNLPYEIYNQERFNQISCVIVDYDMPGVNGLEICSQISNPNIRKILLTGAADEHLAIDAFNKKLIDSYIKKSDPNMIDKVNQVIIEAERNYFNNLSTLSMNLILNDNPYTALNEPEFIRIFNELIKKYNIIEYYLFAEYGCFTMLNKKGEVFALFTYPHEDMIEIVEESKDRDIFTLELAKDLLEGRKMICNDGQEDHFRSCEIIKGKERNYCYAFTDDIIKLDKEKIYSFVQACS